MDDTDIFKHFLLFRGEKGLLTRLYFLDVNNYFFLQRVCLCNYVHVAVYVCMQTTYMCTLGE